MMATLPNPENAIVEIRKRRHYSMVFRSKQESLGMRNSRVGKRIYVQGVPSDTSWFCPYYCATVDTSFRYFERHRKRNASICSPDTSIGLLSLSAVRQRREGLPFAWYVVIPADDPTEPRDDRERDQIRQPLQLSALPARAPTPAQDDGMSRSRPGTTSGKPHPFGAVELTCQWCCRGATESILS